MPNSQIMRERQSLVVSIWYVEYQLEMMTGRFLS